MKKQVFQLGLFLIGLLGGAGLVEAATGDPKAELDLSSEDFEQTITCPDLDAWHGHGYENTTTPEENQESYMVVHQLRIYLHDDFMDSIDLDTLECSTPSAWVACDGGSSSDYGGVELEFIQGDTSSDAVYPNYVEWTYGTSDITQKPLAPGKNDYDGDGTVDNTQDERDMGESIYFLFKEDAVTGNTASTTSAIYVQFWSYDQTCGDFEDMSCWTAAEEDGETGKHWNTHTYTATTTYECEEEEVPELSCKKLEIDPTTADLSVSNVFKTVDFEVTATANDGSDITGDSTFQYEIFNYEGTANADGTIAYGYGYLGEDKAPETTDSTVRWKNTEPGDSLYVYVSDYDGKTYENTCNVTVQLPYCTDLKIIEPTAFQTVASGSYTENIVIEAEASTGEDWPYNVIYSSDDTNATFDGNPSAYVTKDWTVDVYSSDESSTFYVNLDDENKDKENDDVANLCSDDFTYTVIPLPGPICEDLTLTTPNHFTCEEMQAGNIEISWTSTMTDGSPSTGPWEVTSSNPNGIFRLNPQGPVEGTGSVTVSSTTVYYTGEGGDVIHVFDRLYPLCAAVITSEECRPEAPVCEDLTLGDPYLRNNDGSTNTLDLSDSADLAALYQESTVCFDFNFSVSASSYSGTLVAEGFEDATQSAYNGNLSLVVNETAARKTGNPAFLGITGFTQYTGTVCWENFEENNVLSLYLLGDEAVCSDRVELPPVEIPPEQLVCVDLQMSPDSYTMNADDADAGSIPLTITVQGSSPEWTGTLIIEKNGTGQLLYNDGSASNFSDGHLEIPVSGVNTTVTVSYSGGQAGDTVTAYIQGDVAVCTDNLSITQESKPPPEIVIPPEEEFFCQDIHFEEEEFDLDLICEDIDTEICNKSNRDQTIEICYEDENGDDADLTVGNESDTDNNGCVTVELEAGQCEDVHFEDVCEGAEIEAREAESGDFCADIEVNHEEEVIPELPELGEFEKFIFTFNFSLEKNSYSDENIFFSHNEDRAFYTLEYEPEGEEEELRFTDQMWEGSLLSEQGGSIDLAKTPEELTNVTAYDQYESIRAMGFGEEHEAYSEDLAQIVEDLFNSGNYMSFIPYIKYAEARESVMIPACEYDGTDLQTQEVCYNPQNSPSTTMDVVLENVGTVDEDYGEDATIRIRYVGIVVSGLACNSNTDECLTEEFTNTAEVEMEGSSERAEAEAHLVVLCSYLLTQNAGDIYLEESLTGGSDLACIYSTEESDGDSSSSYRNVDALVILDETSTEGTTTDDSSTQNYTPDYEASTISVCDGNEDSNNLISNLSSYVCEIVNTVAELWKKSTVESTTETRINQATRNASTGQFSASESYPASGARSASARSNWDALYNTLKNQNNPDNHILYFNGKHGGADAGTLRLGSLEVPCGAWTVIVENAQLILAGDITYASSCTGSNATEYYKNLPSVAFVVQGGDIYIETSAVHLHGVYYTNQIFDGENRSAVNGILTIDGSLYGNIQTLLTKTDFVAPPTMDGGGLVVRYDSRILLNTPPALADYLDIHTEKALN